MKEKVSPPGRDERRMLHTGFSQILRRRVPFLSAVLGAVVFWCTAQALRLALSLEYGVDETTYAHGAWLIAQGKAPYTDFFFHHFPFALELMSPIFSAVSAPGESMRALRLIALLSFFVTTGTAMWMNRRFGLFSLTITPLIFLIVAPLSLSHLEIRPDSFAFAFFMVSLALGRRPVLRGALLACACWTSEKVLVYGLPLLFTLAFDRRALLGFLGIFGVVVTHTLLNSSLAEWWRWCIEWNLVHETEYPRREWLNEILLYASSYWWIGGLAVVGFLSRRMKSERVLRWTLLPALAAFALQQAPYRYSLIPFLALLCLFAARGAGILLARVVDRLPPISAPIAAVLSATGAFLLLLSAPLPLGKGNQDQHQTFNQLSALLAPGDCVYDNSGGAVTYPSAHFFYFTDRLVRTKKADLLVKEIPTAILRNGCPALLVDFRHFELPDELQRFLRARYLPYSPHLWLWGSRHPAGTTGHFFAPVDGEYFVAGGGQLQVGTDTGSGGTFRLTKGHYIVQCLGASFDCTLLWLPRNGIPWSPMES